MVLRGIGGAACHAVSRLLVGAERKLYGGDSEGGGFTQVSAPGEEVLSPTWSPDGSRYAYTRFGAGTGSVVIQGTSGGPRSVVRTEGERAGVTPTSGCC